MVDRLALEEEIDDALCARNAVQWCLDWAGDLSHGNSEPV